MNLPDYIPNIHPLLVHFPIVLIPLGFGVHLVCLLLKRIDEYRIPIGIVYLAATAGAAAAFFSGRQAADTVSVHPHANLVLSEHADLALWTLVISLISTLLYWVWLRFKPISILPWIALTLSLINVGFLVITADQGGLLVYGYGTGVTFPLENPIDHQKNESASRISMDSDGSWSWKPQIGNDQNDFSEFLFIEGKSSDLKSNPEENEYFSIDKSVLFVMDKNQGDVQVEIQLNVNKFEGTVSIIHHFDSPNQFDFLEISTDKITLGRVENGERNEMDSKSIQVDDWVFLKAIGSGRHFKGYLNDKLVVHGHSPAFDSGKVGLIINGNGALGLRLLNTILLQQGN